MKIKVCTKCKIEKELSEFSLDNKRKCKLTPACKKCRQEQYKRWQQSHKNECAKRYRLYYLKNKEKRDKSVKDYCKKNKIKVRKQRRIIFKQRMKSDISFKILTTIRKRIRHAIKNNIKSESSNKLLDCTIDKARKHLESQFKEGMTWDNYGRKKGLKCWEIDHIRPCASFDLSKESEQHKCFHYTNLQPLWAKANKIKGTKWN